MVYNHTEFSRKLNGELQNSKHRDIFLGFIPCSVEGGRVSKTHLKSRKLNFTHSGEDQGEVLGWGRETEMEKR